MGMNEAKYQLNDLFGEDDKIVILRDIHEFGGFLRDYRLKNGLNTLEMSRLIEVSPQGLRYWEERIRYPSLRSVFTIMKKLEINKVIVDIGGES